MWGGGPGCTPPSEVTLTSHMVSLREASWSLAHEFPQGPSDEGPHRGPGKKPTKRPPSGCLTPSAQASWPEAGLCSPVHSLLCSDAFTPCPPTQVSASFLSIRGLIPSNHRHSRNRFSPLPGSASSRPRPPPTQGLKEVCKCRLLGPGEPRCVPGAPALFFHPVLWKTDFLL